ncbi:MAG: DNA adenine methylase [Planctomycetes bacterium]|nr:DNA adenine methylase [Planctomycetota bacterium]
MTQSTIKKLKSPVSRIGGKARLAPWLHEFIPDHTLYIEPFCGGASLLFAKNPSKVEVLNDRDNYLIEFFSAIRKPDVCKQIQQSLDDMPISRTYWQCLNKKWHRTKPRELIPALSEWFYLNRLTFAADQKYGGFAAPSLTGRNPGITFRNVVKKLSDIAERLENVLFECLPYWECIKKYDSPGTFFYVDPPYLSCERFYPDKFEMGDHIRLAELLHEVKGKVIISHTDHPFHSEYYADWTLYQRQSFKGSHKSAGGKKPMTVECIWLNY